MTITHTDIYRLSIPMVPFRIATGTMDHTQNLFIRIHTAGGLTGVGECSAFPYITGETQDTCLAMARLFAGLWKGKDAAVIPARLAELDAATAGNRTAKSAFDMALHDLAARAAGLPLYRYLGGTENRGLETDLTIGIGDPGAMADTAAEFLSRGFRILKVKLGTTAGEDIARIKAIRARIGKDVPLRIDANQGWDPASATEVLAALADDNIAFCEQPMRTWDDEFLPGLRKRVTVPVMADESVYDHRDAKRLIANGACDYVNIKLAKTGGIAEARRVHDTCAASGIACMMGGMLESRVALTAFAHTALAFPNIRFYDMDTCLLGHLEDPVTGGVRYEGPLVQTPETPGIGADIAEEFLTGCESIHI